MLGQQLLVVLFLGRIQHGGIGSAVLKDMTGSYVRATREIYARKEVVDREGE
jgi:hypothetical protein